jgi:hypothetical protein
MGSKIVFFVQKSGPTGRSKFFFSFFMKNYLYITFENDNKHKIDCFKQIYIKEK